MKKLIAGAVMLVATPALAIDTQPPTARGPQTAGTLRPPTNVPSTTDAKANSATVAKKPNQHAAAQQATKKVKHTKPAKAKSKVAKSKTLNSKLSASNHRNSNHANSKQKNLVRPDRGPSRIGRPPISQAPSLRGQCCRHCTDSCVFRILMQLYPARMSTFSSGSTQAWAKIGTRHVRKSAFERGTAFPQLLRDRRN
jgi:hypothetical protein